SFGHKLNRIRREEQFKLSHVTQFESLTRREYEIVSLLANDYNNPQIAQELYISRSTVEQHRKNINKKLEIHSFRQLYDYALAFDLV
ncbi:LuxR family transcriptional regulator, partial [Fulvivirga sp. RKSG066]|uniref:response regulator transcription factor n=1 Tax=Fulvivirga aurantia TaxID=2529383 RepID=UPI0016270664